jgi:hypothetical protein
MQLIGFVFWYRGLAQGGIAAVGQLQLLQPFFGLALAAALLRESVSATMLAAKSFASPRRGDSPADVTTVAAEVHASPASGAFAIAW